MKVNEAVIAWTPTYYENSPTAGSVIVRHISEQASGWLDEYVNSGGAVYTDWKEHRGWISIAKIFIEFNTLVTRDGIPPQSVHQAFLKIDEYAERISPDMPGAR